MVYLAFRFEWRFAVATIIANLHDVVIILGVFAAFQWEFSLPVLAAVLAILGYSVNESVVVFDRVRENFRKMRRAGVDEIMDASITGTISRTIITHGSTQMMVLVDPLLRRREPALLRARAHHRHLLRHLLVGAGGRPARQVPRRLARGLREAREEGGRAGDALGIGGPWSCSPGSLDIVLRLDWSTSDRHLAESSATTAPGSTRSSSW